MTPIKVEDSTQGEPADACPGDMDVVAPDDDDDTSTCCGSAPVSADDVPVPYEES